MFTNRLVSLIQIPRSLVTIASCTAIAFAILGASETARACDCEFPRVTLPITGDKNVPTNTKIWINTWGCEQAIVQKQGGMPVATTSSRFGNITVIQPAADLELGSTYEVTNCNGISSVVTTFTVTEGPDTTAPEKPTFTMGETQSSGSSLSSCGEELYVPLDVKHEGVVLVLDVASRSTLVPETFTGEPVDAFFPGNKPLVGYAICSSNNWDFDADGDAVNTRLGTFDLAGNFSGMTEPFTVEPSCTCAVVGNSGSSDHGTMVGLAVASLAAIRRRLAGKTKQRLLA